MTNNPYPHLPLPPGAVKADWEDFGAFGEFRYFESPRRIIDDYEVYACGAQDPEGAIECEIVLGPAEDGFTPQQARQLARALIAAADEVERWEELSAVNHHMSSAQLPQVQGEPQELGLRRHLG